MKIIFFFNDNEKDRGIDLNKEITWFLFSEKNKNTFVFNVEISSKGEKMYVGEDSKEFIVVSEVTDVTKRLKSYRATRTRKLKCKTLFEKGFVYLTKNSNLALQTAWCYSRLL